MKDMTEWATIGNIVAPFGIRGELKVHTLTDVPDRFAQLKSVYLGEDKKIRGIEGVRPYKGEMVILKLKGINDATIADTLRKCDLFIPISDLAQLPADSYYQHDILGLQVWTLAGRDVGTIVDIIVTGGNDVYVVKEQSGKQSLIPAIKDVVKQIDLVRHVMYIDPMQGLLDDEEAIKDDATEEETE